MKQLPEDKMLRQFWQDSQKEAPEGFSDFIMQNLPQQAPLSEALKKPLISLKVVGFLLAGLALIAALLAGLNGSSETAAAWYQPMQQGIISSLSWFNASGLLLPGTAILSAALVLLIGLDKLLQRFLKVPQG